MALSAPSARYCIHQSHETASSPLIANLIASAKAPSTSVFLKQKAKIDTARAKLMRLASLQAGWDTYNAEPPNETSRAYAERLLAVLELSSLIPARVLPSAEGGIALTFVASRKRAEIEVYNSGEMVAATYSDQDQLDVWEFAWTEAPATVAKIRVYLSA